MSEVDGFTVSIARPTELDAVFALRYAAFHEQGLIEPAAWPGERMVDRFDTRAVHFVMRDPEGQIVGTARLVHADAGSLPIFDLFDFDPVDGAGCEIGRLAIDARWRGKRAPLVALVRATMQHARDLGHSRVYAFVPGKAVRMYSVLGLTVWQLDTRPPGPDIVSRRARMAPYFASQDPRVVVFVEAGDR